MPDIVLLPTGTRPAVIHAHGTLALKPHWAAVHAACFAHPPSKQRSLPTLTLVTCNNGHPAMGCFERSVTQCGLSCTVLGQGLVPWNNARDKPRLLAEAAARTTTPFMLYADSRDALLVCDPAPAIETFLDSGCDLLFGGDVLSFPPDVPLKRHEDTRAGPNGSPFRYLNGGAWIGRTSFVREFFSLAAQRPALPSAPRSEQGILRQLLPHFGSKVGIDYARQIFANIGFILSRDPLFHIASSGSDATPANDPAIL